MTMRKYDWLAAIVGLLLAVFASVFAPVCFAQAQDTVLSGQWLVERHSGSGPDKDLQVTLRYQRGVEGSNHFYNSTSSFDIASSNLRGFDPSALASVGAKSQFDLVRDAGTFHCEGWFANGTASGHWTFAPNVQYAAALAQKGIGAPTPEQQMHLALSNSSLELVDALKQAGYSFDVDGMIRAANHGINLEYVRGMNQLGYKPETLAYLIKMRDHGVHPEYVRELAAAGLDKLPAPEIIKMRDHGVNADYIHGLAQHGIKGLDGEQLARLRDHGVNPEFIAGMQASGINGAPQDWIKLRDHGVTPGYIAEVRDAGLKTASPEELVRLRDHGVNADYIRHYGSGHSVEELIHMHDRGVRAEL